MNTPNSPAGASGTNDSYTLPAQTKERPILFSGEMVRAILDGKKTQTRRVIKPQPTITTKSNYLCNFEMEKGKRYAAGLGVEIQNLADCFKGIGRFCPYGKVGDRLWVRETHLIKEYDFDYHVTYFADGETKIFKSNVSGMFTNKKTRPSIHMPRHFSRIDLEVTDIRIERLREINTLDIKNEGVEILKSWDTPDVIFDKFIELWDGINAKRGYGWDKNPWVWVVTFKRV